MLFIVFFLILYVLSWLAVNDTCSSVSSDDFWNSVSVISEKNPDIHIPPNLVGGDNRIRSSFPQILLYVKDGMSLL